MTVFFRVKNVTSSTLRHITPIFFLGYWFICLSLAKDELLLSEQLVLNFFDCDCQNKFHHYDAALRKKTSFMWKFHHYYYILCIFFHFNKKEIYVSILDMCKLDQLSNNFIILLKLEQYILYLFRMVCKSSWRTSGWKTLFLRYFS